MSTVTMYSTQSCPFCVRAEQLLQRKGINNIQKIMLEDKPETRNEMVARTGRRSVPQIFIGDHHVGGFDDLVILDRAGKLDPMLAA